MNKRPDFVGNWVFPEPWMDVTGYGDFQMFITEKNPTGRTASIKGTIDDRFGSATFEGTLSENEIKFIKKYLPEAVENGAASDRVEYRGIKKDRMYVGKFTVINGITQGRRGDWSGDFYVISPDSLSQN